MSRLKVLLVYPNYMMVNLLPTNIGILTACLLKEGYTTDLFNTTIYRTAEKSIDEMRAENLQFRKFNLSDVGIYYKENPVEIDFQRKVKEFKPDLIGVSTVEDTWPQAVRLLRSLPENLSAKVIVGGVFPTLAPDVVLKELRVNYVCLGEGEEAIIEVCRALEKGDEPIHVKNIWGKNGGKIFRNCMRPPIPLEEVPFADFSLFEEKRCYRPMAGKIFRMFPVETDRGCPYTCRFCEAPELNKIYRKETKEQIGRRKSGELVR